MDNKIIKTSIDENLSNVKFEWLNKQAEVIYPFEETDEEGYLLVDNGAGICNTLVANDLVNINIDVLVDFDDVDSYYDDGWWEEADRLGRMPSGWNIEYNSVDYRVIYELAETEDRITIDEAATTLGITKDELQAEVDRRCKELFKTNEIYLDNVYLKYMEDNAPDPDDPSDWYMDNWD